MSIWITSPKLCRGKAKSGWRMPIPGGSRANRKEAHYFSFADNTPRALYFAFRNHVSGERGPLSWSKQCHALVLSPFKKRSGRSRWRQEFGTSNSVIREGQYG